MVTAYMPQKHTGNIDSNTNYPPQRFDESGGIPGGVDMAYEDGVTMQYEDLQLMEYES